MSRNKEHRGAAFGGRPIGSLFFVSAHLSFDIMNIYGYSLYLPCFAGLLLRSLSVESETLEFTINPAWHHTQKWNVLQ